LTIPDLNTRETAIVLWTAATLMVALATPSLRTILAEGVRIARQPLVRVLLTCTTVIVVVATGLLALLGYWQPSMLATTVAWFLGTAIVGTFSMGGVGELRELILRVVAATALIEFVANAYTFPLLVELFVVAFVIVVVTLASFSELRPEFAILRRPFSVLCVALLVGTITPTVVYVAHHPGELASAERAREFLVPLILTVALAPYLYCVRMTVVWQTALSMLGSEMADRPELLKAARRAMVRSCRLSLTRIKIFEPRFRWMLSTATSEEDIDRAIRAFKQAFAERPRRSFRESIHAITRVRVRELLPSAGGGGFLSHSVTLADQVTDAVAAAAASMGATPEEVTEMLGRLDGVSAIGRVEQAQVVRVLGERGRSMAEIELIVPELGKLATLHATDIVPLAGEFEALLRLARLSADGAPRIADEVHVLAATSGLDVPDTVGVFVTLLGGGEEPERVVADA
jgi:hypothetical protein